MKHHRPHKGDRHRRRHHRHDEQPAQEAAQGKARVEDAGRKRAEDERQNDGKNGVGERVPPRLDEARVAGEAQIIGEADECRRRANFPLVEAHPDGERPGKDDDSDDDDKRRHDERPIRRVPPSVRARRFSLTKSRCSLRQLAHAFSLRSWIGRYWSVAFFISVAGSAPDNVAVNAEPKMSRNSATGTTTGNPSLLIFAEPITASSHSRGIFTPLRTLSSLRIELRKGTPPPICSSRAPIVFDTAHWQ